jgi:hypothetical protein
MEFMHKMEFFSFRCVNNTTCRLRNEVSEEECNNIAVRFQALSDSTSILHCEYYTLLLHCLLHPTCCCVTFTGAARCSLVADICTQTQQTEKSSYQTPNASNGNE